MYNIIYSTDAADLMDIGDSIGQVKFKSKSNSVSPGVIRFLNDLLENDFFGCNGLVIANEGKNFSVGADLSVFLSKIDNHDYGNPNDLGDLHKVLLRLKYFHKPVVAVPFGYTLGGGCEVVMHCHAVVCPNNLHIGLVEVGVGLVPAGGGTKESLLSILNYSQEKKKIALLSLFERLIIRTWSHNAKEAIEWGMLPSDTVIVDESQLLNVAKNKCLELTRDFRPRNNNTLYELGGKNDYDFLIDRAKELFDLGVISDHDLVIAHYIALILSGGNELSSYKLTESDICLLEMRGLCALRATTQTRDRIAHLLETGELLKN